MFGSGAARRSGRRRRVQAYLDLLSASGRVAQQRLGGRGGDGDGLLRAAVFAAGLMAVPASLPASLPEKHKGGKNNIVVSAENSCYTCCSMASAILPEPLPRSPVHGSIFFLRD